MFGSRRVPKSIKGPAFLPRKISNGKQDNAYTIKQETIDLLERKRAEGPIEFMGSQKKPVQGVQKIPP